MKPRNVQRLKQVKLILGSILITLFLTFIIDSVIYNNLFPTFINDVLIPNKKTNNNELSKRKLIRKFPSIKSFEEWDRGDLPFPCIQGNNEENSNGIYYIRLPNTSSKGATVSERIALLETKRTLSTFGDVLNAANNGVCKINEVMKPIKAFDQHVSERNKKKSFLWSIVRHPARRAISYFDDRLRHKLVAGSNEFIADIMNGTTYQPNTMLSHLSTDKYVHNIIDDEQFYINLIENILREYNFIGVQERMHESLVALSMLIGVDMHHVMYHFSRCLSTNLPFWMTKPYVDFIELDDGFWKQRHSGDYILYDAVNAALDLTIKNLDKRGLFRSRLRDFELLLDTWSKASEKFLLLGDSTMMPTGHYCGAAFFSSKPDRNLDDWLNNLSLEEQTLVLGK